MKKGILKSQFLRIRRICSREADFLSFSRQFSNFLKNRGFSDRTLRTAFREAKNTTHNRNKTQTRTNRPILVQTYYPYRKIDQERINRAWDAMIFSENTELTNFTDFELGKTFSGPPMIAWRKPRNIQQMLIRSKLN